MTTFLPITLAQRIMKRLLATACGCDPADSVILRLLNLIPRRESVGFCRHSRGSKRVQTAGGTPALRRRCVVPVPEGFVTCCVGMGGNFLCGLQTRASRLRLMLIRNISIRNSREHIQTAHAGIS